MPKETRCSKLRSGITKTILAGSLAVAAMPAWSFVDSAVATGENETGQAATFAPELAYAADDTTFVTDSSKDETVYVKTNAKGTATGVYVVNRFAAGTGVALDPANYLSLSNMSTSDVLEQTNGKVEVPLQGGEPFYYEGEMPAQTALPWTVSLKYLLDGKEIAPEDLFGASGKVRIELSISARTSAPEAGVADFANSYVLQAQGTFDSNTFEIDENDELMVAQIGSESVVNCMVLPGKSQSFAIEGEARAFASSGWQISAMPLSLAIDIAEQDTSQLTDATSQLIQAINKLADGSNSMTQGMGEASKGASGLSQGSSSLASGAAELSEGMDALLSGGGSLLEGWAKVKSGTDVLAEGADKLADGSDTYLETLQEKQGELENAALLQSWAKRTYDNALSKYVAEPTDANKAVLEQALNLLALANQAVGAREALDQTIEGYANLGDGIDEAQEGVRTLASGIEEFDSYLQEYVAGVSSAGEGANALAEGAEDLSQGASQLFAGTGVLESGAEALASGSSQLAASVKNMDAEVLEGIQKAIDEKLGSDFEAHSFVSPENTSVSSVQFVYMVDGVSAKADANDAAVSTDADGSAEENPGIIERFIAWLKGLFGK